MKEEDSWYLRVLKKEQERNKKLKPLDDSAFKDLEQVKTAFKSKNQTNYKL